METYKEVVVIAGKKYLLERILEGTEHPDWCKMCAKITGDWGTPNGNTYCSECNHYK